MEKRLILAIVLSFLVLMGYQYFFVKPNKADLNPPVPVTAPPSTPVPGTAGAIREQAKPAPAESVPAPAPAPGAVAGQAEKDVVVDTPLYRAVWSNKGGVLKSWKLKKYKNVAGTTISWDVLWKKLGGKKAQPLKEDLKEDLELVPA
ncbi:MAG: membrane protein insertase YidC, partial [Candidatus Aminicenantes bacterium]|nr:membrane protein insertase YidC [Candidatus Aminicenantes bacterium]